MDDVQKATQTDEILEYYSRQEDKSSQESIIEMLRELQEVNGCITAKLKERAATAAGVNVSVVSVLVRIYPSLKEAAYLHEIIVCTGKACSDKGAGKLLKLLQKRLRIQKNGLSRDGKFCVRTRSCFKQCRTAPNIYVDGVLHEGVTESKMQHIIDQLLKDGV